MMSWAEGQRGHLAVFYGTLNKLLSKAASGMTRRSWISWGNSLCIWGVIKWKTSSSIRKRKQKQWLPSVLGISMALGYKVVSRFTICIDFLLRVLWHNSLELTLKGRTGFSHLLSHGVTASTTPPSPSQALASRQRLRMRHEYAKLKLRPPQRSRSHENCYWVPTGVCTVPHFSCGTIVLHLHLTGTVLVSH